MGKLLIGTSGYSYKDWKEIFYPKGLAANKWLAFYAARYDTVEINATFYRYFPRHVFARWHHETPDHFRFTLKGPKEITHNKRLENIEDDLKRFLESIPDIRPKLALLLWQFPFSFKYDESKDLFRAFLEQLPRDIKHVFEFRHKTWFNDELYGLLDEHNAGFVINDSSRFPAAEKITGDFAYIRFHGPTKLYASLYTPEQLEVWAQKINTWLTQYDVYVYFNNDYDGRALQNSVELQKMIAAS